MWLRKTWADVFDDAEEPMPLPLPVELEEAANSYEIDGNLFEIHSKMP